MAWMRFLETPFYFLLQQYFLRVVILCRDCSIVVYIGELESGFYKHIKDNLSNVIFHQQSHGKNLGEGLQFNFLIPPVNWHHSRGGHWKVLLRYVVTHVLMAKPQLSMSHPLIPGLITYDLYLLLLFFLIFLLTTILGEEM